MRIFTKLRSFLVLEERLSMDKLEAGTTKMFRVVFERLDSFEENLEPTLPEKRTKIGLKNNDMRHQLIHTEFISY